MIRSALAGVLSAAAGVAAAELVAAALDRPAAAPVFAVGGPSSTPRRRRSRSSRSVTVGTYDKPLLLAGIALGLVVIAAVVGVLAPPPAVGGAAGCGRVRRGRHRGGRHPAGLAAGRRAAVAGRGARHGRRAVLDAALASGRRWCRARPRRCSARRRLRGCRASRAGVRRASPPGVQSKAGAQSRRAFLGRAGRWRSAPARSARGAFAIGRVPVGRRRPGRATPSPCRRPPTRRRRCRPAPRPASTPATPTSTASTPRSPCPRSDVADWRLRITGMVGPAGRAVLRRPAPARRSPSGTSRSTASPTRSAARTSGPPAGSAYRSAPLLREAGVQAGADQVVARGSDGMTIGTPVTTVLDAATRCWPSA